MSDSAGEKTEEPTSKKRADARDEGQVPRSQELNTAVLMLGSALVLGWVGPGLAQSVFGIFGFTLVAAGAQAMDARAAVALIHDLGWRLLGSLSVFLLAMAGISLAIAGVQARGILTLKPLQPKFKKLDVVQNSKKFVGTQPWAELVKSLLKVGVIALAVYWALRAAWPEVLALTQQDPAAMLAVVRRYAIRLLLTAGLMYLAIGLLDYGYQLWQHEKKLKMSKEEVRKENKQAEVDPMVRARMRSLARERLRRQMFEQVPTADVVVTNPTHIAVALKYEQGKDVAPLVVAMGRNKIAERIKAIAAEHGVPRVENKPVARALLASARVGESIPQELYVAIIEIYAFIIRQRQAGLQGRRN
jgi:flagellar biosynthesis protein FlhB